MSQFPPGKQSLRWRKFPGGALGINICERMKEAGLCQGRRTHAILLGSRRQNSPSKWSWIRSRELGLSIFTWPVTGHGYILGKRGSVSLSKAARLYSLEEVQKHTWLAEANTGRNWGNKWIWIIINVSKNPHIKKENLIYSIWSTDWIFSYH